MSYVQKNMKFLKEKQKNLEFFESYLDISKLRILQVLNEEQRALETLKTVKYSNTKLLESVNVNFFKGEKTYIEADPENRNSREEIYFLIDAKENDEYAEVMYKKLEETLEARIKRGDSVITIGRRVNLIAQKLELNIIQHYDYELYENQNDFIYKISTLIEIAFKNGIFTDATMIIAQQNQDNRDLIIKKLAPFEQNKSEEETFDKLMEESSRKSKDKDQQQREENINILYGQFFKKIDIKQLSWLPNIDYFKLKLIKAIIKQSIFEIVLVEKIQRLKLEIQLLDEKRNKLHDELTVIKRLVNRVRREKETESTIVLYSAFKVRSESNNIMDEGPRKKFEEDDTLYRVKKAQQKGGRK